MDPSPLVSQVLESNLRAREAWDLWAPHRARVMDVVRGVPVAGPRLALVGTGHLHDVWLSELLQRYERIALVDLDADTVSAALRRYPGASA